MSVLSHLNKVSSALVLTDTEKSGITTSLSTLGSRLDSYFSDSIITHFKFGSYNRTTNLPRKVDRYSDVDYMVIFSTSDGKKKPQTYLDRLRNFANAKYATSEISQSNPTIVLSLNHIRFELVPAVSEFGFYNIPSPASSWVEWMHTEPFQADIDILEKNKNNNYEIKPLVRLIKYWNALQGYPYSSYYLERAVINKYYLFCTSLKDYFYQFWSDFDSNWNDSQSTKDKVARAKMYAANAKDYELKEMPLTAEVEIKKIIPEL